MKTKFYTVYTGMRNPRTPTEIGWRLFDSYDTMAEAKKAIRADKLTFWHIQECEIVASNVPEV